MANNTTDPKAMVLLDEVRQYTETARWALLDAVVVIDRLKVELGRYQLSAELDELAGDHGHYNDAEDYVPGSTESPDW